MKSQDRRQRNKIKNTLEEQQLTDKLKNNKRNNKPLKTSKVQSKGMDS